MKFKISLLTLFCTTAFAAHVNDRAIYQTDVKDLSGTSVFSFPTTHPTASRACTFNSDGEATSSSVTSTELGFLSGVTSSIQTQLNGKQATVSFAAVGSTPNANGGGISGGVITLQPADATHPGLVTTGTQSIAGAKTLTDTLTISKTSSLGDPSTSSHFSLVNPAGATTSIAFTFGATTKSGIMADNIGNILLRPSGSYGVEFFVGSPIASQYEIGQIDPNGMSLYNGGGVFADGRISAGLAVTNPIATLTDTGSFALKSKLVTADYTASVSESILYCDTSNSYKCVGSATACSSYSYSACASHTAVGCHQATDGNCSTADGTNSGTCTGLNPACSWTPGNCSVFTNETDCGAHSGEGCTTNTVSCGSFSDLSSCNAHPGCSPSTSNCSDFTTIGDCDAHNSDGCTTSTGDCSTYNGNPGTCTTTTGCSYNFGDDTCSGSYLTSCSGSYFVTCNGGDVFSSCTGTYDSGGTCNGGNYGTCAGTAACGTATNSGDCGASPPCGWAQALTLTLPSIRSGIPAYRLTDTTSDGWLVRIMKVAGSGTVTVVPDSADTIQGDPSQDLPGVYDKVTLHPLWLTSDCAVFNNDQTSCQANFGCSYAAFNCSTFTDSESCGAVGCNWTGVSCDGTTTQGNCNGSYSSTTTWMKW